MRGSLTREGRWGGASLTGKRSDFCVRKNPTEDASPAPGGTGLRPSRGKPVPPGAGDALGIGSDPSRQGRGRPPPPLAGRGPPPPLAGRVRRLPSRVGAPHGANYDSTREPILATSEASREYTKTSSIP